MWRQRSALVRPFRPALRKRNRNDLEMSFSFSREMNGEVTTYMFIMVP